MLDILTKTGLLASKSAATPMIKDTKYFFQTEAEAFMILIRITNFIFNQY